MSNLDKNRLTKASFYTFLIVLIIVLVVKTCFMIPYIMMIVFFWLLILCVVGVLIYALWKYIYDNLNNNKKE
jgi:hypothetical protein